MAKYHGFKGQVRMNGTLVSLATWELDKAADTVRVTSFGDLNHIYVIGLADVKGSFNGFWDDTDTTMLAAAENVAGVMLSLYPSSLTALKYHYGQSLVTDYKMSVDVNGSVQVSGSFMANGTWGHIGV